MFDVGAHLHGWEGQMRGGAGGCAFDCLGGGSEHFGLGVGVVVWMDRRGVGRGLKGEDVYKASLGSSAGATGRSASARGGKEGKR